MQMHGRDVEEEGGLEVNAVECSVPTAGTHGMVMVSV